MSHETTFWVAVILGGAVTYAIRAALFLLAGRMTELPANLRVALRMIPPAALAALAIPPLLRPDSPAGSLALLSPELLAGAVAAAVAWKTHSLLATIAAGMVVVLALQPVLG